MKSGIIVFVIMLSTLSDVILSQQEIECAAVIPPGVTVQQAQSNNLGLFKRTTTTPPLRLAIHIVRYSNGSSGITQTNLNEKLDSLNSIMSQALFSFYVFKMDTIDSDYFANIDSDQKANELRLVNVVDGCINIYFVPASPDFDGTSSFSPRIQDPGLYAEQGIIIKNSAHYTTLPHEMGHYFDLFHTHTIYFGIENISRDEHCANFNYAGDLLYDTPADPSERVESPTIDHSNCQWIDPPIKPLPPDGCNQTNYSPLANNMMITQANNCRTTFTQNQKDRMNETLLVYRSELLKHIVYLENSANSSNAGGTLHIGENNYNSGTPAFVNTGDYDTGTNNERFENYQGSGFVYKHNNWNEANSDYFLSRNIAINFDMEKIGKFNSLNSTTVRNVIDGISFNDQLPVWFNDPWYVKDENNNQSGMNNFIDPPPPSPYNPTGKYNESTGGVFLNQGWPNWNPPYYSVKVPQAVQNLYFPHTGRYHNFYFQGWTGTEVQFENSTALQTGVVFKDDILGVDPVVNANLKGTQLSNQTDAYNSNSQRKTVRSDDGWLHNVYESMGRVWYETSSDNGATWTLANNGQPIDNGEGKQPSIDYAFFSVSHDYYQVFIVYQEKSGASSKIKVKYFHKVLENPGMIYKYQADVASVSGNYANVSTTPVVGSYSGNFTVLWKNGTGSLYFRSGVVNISFGITMYDSYPLTGTNGNSINPAIHSTKTCCTWIKHIAWQENDQIKYSTLNGTTIGTIETPSSNSPYSENRYPSISLANGNPVLSWTVSGMPVAEKIAAKDNFERFTSKAIVCRKGTNWGDYQLAGNDVTYTNNNSVSSAQEKTVIIWSEGTTNP